MVKKLLKHEFSYYLRHLSIVYIVLLCVALGGRFIRFFESESPIFTIFNTSAMVALYLASMAALTLTIVFCIIRFFKNLFGGEGYLTLTLPVTMQQHLLTKLIGSICAYIATLLIVLTGVCVLFSGDWLVEICKAIGYNLREQIPMMGVGNFIGYVFEGVLLIPVMLAAHFMTFYTCVCIGQTLRRGRVIAAIGIYYGINTLIQILGYALILICALFNDAEGLIRLLGWMNTNTHEFLHVLLCGGIVIGGLWSALCFMLSARIMRRKINLE